MQVDGVEALPVNEAITLLRGTCSTQLKFEIEYGMKRGTSDNSYLIQVCYLNCRVTPCLEGLCLSLIDQM